MSYKITKAEMLRAIRRLINIGRTGVVLITIKERKGYRKYLREVKNEDYFKEIYTKEFLEKLKKLEKEVEEWEND